MITKAKVILVTHLVTLVLANVSTFDQEVSGITEMEEGADPMADGLSTENAMDMSETHHRRYYYPRTYHYPRYSPSYAPTRNYYNNYYKNHGSYYRPAYRPVQQPQYSYYPWSSSSDSSSDHHPHVPDVPHIPHISNDPPIIADPPHIPHDPPQDFSHLHHP